MDRSRASLFVVVVSCVTVFICFHTSSGADKKSGKYEVDVVGVRECSNPGTNEMQFQARVSKLAREACFSGWYYMPYGMTDDLQEVWIISMRGSTGGWKRLLTFRNRHACSDRKRLFPEWFVGITATNLTDGECPVPPGNYTFGCYTLRNLRFSRVKEMLYGAYRSYNWFYRNNTVIGCVMYEANLYPVANYTESGLPEPLTDADTRNGSSMS